MTDGRERNDGDEGGSGRTRGGGTSPFEGTLPISRTSHSLALLAAMLGTGSAKTATAPPNPDNILRSHLRKSKQVYVLNNLTLFTQLNFEHTSVMGSQYEK